ncbi:MAG: T9SS type A sorting domain-containing protein, partial [Bacteroidales bacterium]|nr:T9SS type A sorting domain-containing protein [Bacteroidales bacterium]
SSREIMIYSSDGQLKEKIIQKYDQAWTNFLRYQYYYNANDLLLEENLAFWVGSAWDNVSTSYDHAYDEMGNLTSKTKILVSGSKKKNISKEEFTYSYNGRLEEYFISNWNKRKDCWTNKNRSIYVNSMNGYVVSMLNQNNSKKEWVNYFFTEFTGRIEAFTGTEMADYMTFAVYPTQFGDKAKIEFDNPNKEFYHIRVINENGQLVGSATTKKDEISIAASNLNRGLYFVELQGSNLYSGKFSIE